MDENVREQIRSLITLAEASPVYMPDLVISILTPEGKKLHQAQMTRQSIIIPMGFLVVYSIETGQPLGPCRHLSVAIDKKGRAPHPIGVWMVAVEFGFRGGLDKCVVWPEKLTQGTAVNVLQAVNYEVSKN